MEPVCQKAKSISVSMLNIRGLTEEKVEHLAKTEIIMLCETWLKAGDTIPIDNYEVHNFYVKELHKKARRGCGGISVYICEAISNSCRIIKGDENVVWIEVKAEQQAKPLAISGNYFPPEGSNQLRNHIDLFTKLELDIAELSQTHSTILLGDFNAHTNNSPDFIAQTEGCDIPNNIMDESLQMNDIPSDMANLFLNIRNSQDMRPLRKTAFRPL